MDEPSHYKLLLVDYKGAIVITLGFYAYYATNHAFDLGLKSESSLAMIDCEHICYCATADCGF